MFGRKKKNEAEKPAMTPSELADKIGQQAGLLPDEMLKLLDSLERVENNRIIIQRKAVKQKIVDKKPISLAKAVEFAQEKIEEHKRREEIQRLIHKKKLLKYVEIESRDIIEDTEYPRKLSPYDIGKSIDTAKKRLREEEERQEEDQPVNRKTELILNVLDRTKITEAARVAHKIASRQNRIGLFSLEEAERRSNLPQEEQMEMDPEIEEQLKIARSLNGFKRKNNTIVDDAASVVDENIDAAASVVKQWVGAIHEEK